MKYRWFLGHSYRLRKEGHNATQEETDVMERLKRVTQIRKIDVTMAIKNASRLAKLE